MADDKSKDANSGPSTLKFHPGAQDEKVLPRHEPTPPARPPLPLPGKGRQVGDYHLLLEMGRSVTDTVFLSRGRESGAGHRLVVVRELDEHLGADPEFFKTFFAEAHLALRIRHPHLVQLLELGNIGQMLFVVNEYVHGQSLADLVRAATSRNIALPWHYVTRVVADAADGLHAAHEFKGDDGKPLNLVHRKVTLKNILIGYDGDVKLADLGVASAAEKFEQTSPAVRVQRAAYMSPEQVRGDPVDRRSDVFSLGVVLFEAACQRRLFSGDEEGDDLPVAVERARIPRPRKVRPELPRSLDRIILKALAREPDDRFQTAGEMADALEEVLAEHRRSVGGRKLGQVMTRMFGEHRKLKDNQIENALSRTGLPAMEGGRLLSGTSASIDLSRVEFTGVRFLDGRKRKLGKGLFLGAAGFFLAAVALVIFSFLWPTAKRRSGSAVDRGGPAGARDHEPPGPGVGSGSGSGRGTVAGGSVSARRTGGTVRSRKATVILSLIIKPEQVVARVLFQGRSYKGPRLKLVLPRSDKMVDLEVTAPGYVSQRFALAPSEDRNLSIKLVPLGSAAHRNGAAR